MTCTLVSPSSSAPAELPAVHEQAMSRLREVLGAVPPREPGEQARRRCREDHREAVLGVLEVHHPAVRAVFGVDFGNPEPQLVLPDGGRLTVDGPAERIAAHCGAG